MNDQPKLFVIQLGALVSLYALLISLLVLLFSLINILIPDAIDQYWEIRNAGANARGAIAFLLVATPTYLLLTRAAIRARHSDADQLYVPVTRWLIYLSIFVGSAVLLGYAVGVVLQFLNGELTARFILKALATVAIVGGAMAYYIYDAMGYWLTHPKERLYIERAVMGVVAGVIITSFTVIDSPAVVREISIDQQQVQDLQEVEWRIDERIRTNKEVPASIAELYDDGIAPEAPAGREPYSFSFTNESYELCATFQQENPNADVLTRTPPPRTDFLEGQHYIINNFDSWQYKAGRHCFTRNVIFPEVSGE